MAKKRNRYIVTGSIRLNGINVNGLTLVCLGRCGFSGILKAKDGSKLRKNDLKFTKFRFEDPKAAKDLGVPKLLSEFVFSDKQVSMFLTLQNEETA